VAANPGAKDLGLERERFAEKVAAGAHFAQTQPVFGLREVERFVAAVEPSIPVLYGVLPVRSLEMAERVGKWTQVPPALLAALATGGRSAGLAWARQTVAELRALQPSTPTVAGVHLYPLGRPQVVKQLLAAQPAGDEPVLG
jgi:5,10-methylenetetrahydrofolate reductase